MRRRKKRKRSDAADRGDRQAIELSRHYQELSDESDELKHKIKEHQNAVDMPDLKGLLPEFIKTEQATIDVSDKSSARSLKPGSARSAGAATG